MLADLGADVVKVERPGAGDDTAHWGPPFLKDDDGRRHEPRPPTSSAPTATSARSPIDIATPEGQALVRQLAAQADVLVENFKVGGLSAVRPRLRKPRAVNPRLIYCSITGFGQTGPYAARAGYDFLIQGMGGLMSITGRPDGDGRRPAEGGRGAHRPLHRPVRRHRHPGRAGRARAHGPRPAHRHGAARRAGRMPRQPGLQLPDRRRASQRRMGNAHPSIVPYQDFHTADGDS